jgi:hypothetical protein
MDGVFIPREIDDMPGLNARVRFATVHSSRRALRIIQQASHFFEGQFNLIIPGASTLREVGIEPWEFLREIGLLDGAAWGLERELELVQDILYREEREALIQTNDRNPTAIRRAIGEQAINRIISHQVVEFHLNLRNGYYRRDLSRDQRIQWLLRLRLATPTFDYPCTVCLEPLNLIPCVQLPFCSHYFHRECLANWFEHNFICPLCRQFANTRLTANVRLYQ